MGFRSFESIKQANFNSANSSDFLAFFEKAWDDTILAEESSVPSKTFAPSSVRCQRVSWFRLRGTPPEQEAVVDRSLDFTAQIGTACHRTIQRILSQKLGSDWLDVEEYLKSAPRPYEYTCTKNEFETMIEISSPPIKFAPDGIIMYKGLPWLLEIKTSEYNSFGKLTGPKPQHIDQIKCYCTLLNIPRALVLYQDRIYGGLKCYEIIVTEEDMRQIHNMFSDVMRYVVTNIAPPKLPAGDPHCSPSMCRYYNHCKEW